MPSDRSEQRTKTGKEMSAGGIVFKKENNQTFILMITPAPRESATREAYRPVWTFPKGWVGDHSDDSLETNALREVKEEGGVEAKVVGDLGEVQYFVRWQEANIYKTVHWFLMEYISGDPADHDHEVDEASWFDIGEVEGKLVYKEDKEVFAKAYARLANPRN
jgi:ADP-ribose pyrophosphatase YjhB (NUDIX family)